MQPQHGNAYILLHSGSSYILESDLTLINRYVLIVVANFSLVFTVSIKTVSFCLYHITPEGMHYTVLCILYKIEHNINHASVVQLKKYKSSFLPILRVPSCIPKLYFTFKNTIPLFQVGYLKRSTSEVPNVLQFSQIQNRSQKTRFIICFELAKKKQQH